VTKRQRQARIREIQKELLAQMRTRFPKVELLQTEHTPGGMVVMDVYAPYEDRFEVLDSVMDRVVELLRVEHLHFAIVPLKKKPANKSCRRAA
jgi:hypothetical protein